MSIYWTGYGYVTVKLLYQQCDILFLLENGLYRSQLDWCNILGKDGVSTMNEMILLKDRPRGGAAIILKGSINARVTPIDNESQRV